MWLQARKQDLALARIADSAPILVAVKAGDLSKVELLLKGDPHLVFIKDSEGMTPLHWAASLGLKTVAELLLQTTLTLTCMAPALGRYFIPAKMSSGAAAITGQHSAIPLFLGKFTPLHMAAADGHADLVDLLIAHHATVNAKCSFDQIGFKITGSGPTPLQLAIAYKHPDTAEVLREHGYHRALSILLTWSRRIAIFPDFRDSY